jgi:hypothetical protein
MSTNHLNGSILFPSTIEKINVWLLSENMGTYSRIINYYVAEGNATYKSLDGILYSADGETLLRVPGSRSGKLSIPGNPKVIGKMPSYTAMLQRSSFRTAWKRSEIPPSAWQDPLQR